MRFYVASALEDKDRVHTIQEDVKSRGHEIAFDWTTRSNTKPYEEHIDETSSIAAETISAIKDSDVFVAFSRPEGGRGMYVTLGAALMSNSDYGKPQIFVVGDSNENSAFYFHPAVKRLANFDEVWENIR